MTDIRIPFTRSPGCVCLITSLEDDDSTSGKEASAASIELLGQLFEGLHTAIDDLQAQQRQSIYELQQVAVELAVAAASWLTMTVIDRNQFNLEQLIADSIEQLGSSSPVTVRLSPLDHELFTQQQQADDACLTLPSDVHIVSDTGLARMALSFHFRRVVDL